MSGDKFLELDNSREIKAVETFTAVIEAATAAIGRLDKKNLNKLTQSLDELTKLGSEKGKAIADSIKAELDKLDTFRGPKGTFLAEYRKEISQTKAALLAATKEAAKSHSEFAVIAAKAQAAWGDAVHSTLAAAKQQAKIDKDIVQTQAANTAALMSELARRTKIVLGSNAAEAAAWLAKEKIQDKQRRADQIFTAAKAAVYEKELKDFQAHVEAVKKEVEQYNRITSKVGDLSYGLTKDNRANIARTDLVSDGAKRDALSALALEREAAQKKIVADTKAFYAEMSRVADLKGNIRNRLATGDVGVPSTAKPTLPLTSKGGLNFDYSGEGYGQSMSALKAHYESLPGVVNVTAKAKEQLNSRLKETSKHAAEAGTHFKALTITSGDLHSAVRGLAAGFGQLWLAWGNVGPMLVGAGIATSITQAIKKGVEFEQSLYVISELAGNSQTEMAKLSAELLKMGDATRYGPVEAAKGLEVLTLAGLKANEAITALAPTLRFAAAGQVDTNKAAETLVAVSTAYGYNAKEFEVVGDLIAKTAAESMASVQTMSESFKTASVIAQQYKVELKDTAFALKSLADIGITGSAAGTSVRNMYTELSKSSGKVAEALKATNTQVYDSQGKMRELGAIVQDLSVGLTRYSGRSQQKLRDDLANERGGKLLAASLNLVYKEYQKLDKANEASGKGLATTVKEKTALIVEANKKVQESMRDLVDNAAGFTFFASLEESLKPKGLLEGIKATLETGLVSAFEAAREPLMLFAIELRNALKSEDFKEALTGILKGFASFTGAVIDVTKFLYEHKDAVIAVTVAYAALAVTGGAAGLAGSIAALAGTVRTASVAFLQSVGIIEAVTAVKVTWAATTGFVATSLATLAASGTAAGAVVAALGAGMAAAAVTGIAVLTAGVIAGTVALIAWAAKALFMKETAEELAEKAAKAQQDSSEKKMKLLAEEMKTSDKAMEDEIARLEAIKKAKAEGLTESEAAAKVLGEQARARLDNYYQEMRAVVKLTEFHRNAEASRNSYFEDEGVARALNASRAADELAQIDHQWAQARNKLDGQIATLAQLKREEAKAAQDASKGRSPIVSGDDPYAASREQARSRERQAVAKNYAELFSAAHQAYAAQLETLKQYQADEEHILSASRKAKLLSEADYQAKRLALARNSEEDQLRLIASHRQTLTDKYTKEASGIKGKGAEEAQMRLAEQYQSRIVSLDEQEARIHSDRRKRTLDTIADVSAIGNSQLQAAEKWQKLQEQKEKTEKRVQEMRDKAEADGPIAMAGVEARIRAEEAYAAQLEAFDKVFDELNASAILFGMLVKEDGDEFDQLALKAIEKAAQIKTARDRLREKGQKGAEEAEEAARLKTRNDLEKKYLQEKAKEFENLSKQIEDNLFNALTSGGKSGVAELKNMLKQALLSPIRVFLQPVMGTISSGIAGLLMPQGAAASAAGYGSAASAGSNAFSTVSSIGSLAGLSGSLAAGAGWLTGATTLGGSLSAGMSLIGTGTLAGAGSGLGMIAGALGPIALGLGALYSIAKKLDKGGTPHIGGSAEAFVGGVNEVESSLIGFSLSAKDVSKDVVNSSKDLAKGGAALLNQLSVLAGGKSDFKVATGFADDTSKDGAWGSLVISRGGQSVVDWRDTQTSRWAPKEFSDGEKGAKEYANAYAKSLKTAMEAIDLPDWAKRYITALGDNPTMEDLGKAVEAIAALPEQILTSVGTSTSSLTSIMMQGIKDSDPAGAGKAFADTITIGIENSIYQGFSQQIVNIISTGLVTPIVTAMQTGSSLTEAMSKVSITKMVDDAAKASAAMKAILTNADFQQVLKEMNQTIRDGVAGAIGGTSGLGSGVRDLPTYGNNNSPATGVGQNSGTDSAKESTNKYAEALEKVRENTKTAQQEAIRLSEGEKAAKLAIRAEERAKLLQLESDEAIRLRNLGMTAEATQLVLVSEQERLWALEDQNATLTERKTLEDQWRTLVETSTEAFERQISAVEASNQALQRQILLTQRHHSLMEGLEGVLSKYMSEQDYNAYRYQMMAAKLKKAGLPGELAEVSAWLQKATKEDFAKAAKLIFDMGDSALTLQEAVVAIAGEFADMKDAGVTTAKEIAEAFKSAGKSIVDYIRELATGEAGLATPGERLARSRAVYEQDLAKAKSGNTEEASAAAARLAKSAADYIEAQKGYSASNDVTKTVIATVLAQLSNLSFVNSQMDEATKAALALFISARGGVTQFATGGVFTNGIVKRATNFNIGQMGEAGAEAIFPLTNHNGSLGVRATTDPQVAQMLAEIRAELSAMRELQAQIGSATVNATLQSASIVAEATSDAVSSASWKQTSTPEIE